MQLTVVAHESSGTCHLKHILLQTRACCGEAGKINILGERETKGSGEKFSQILSITCGRTVYSPPLQYIVAVPSFYISKIQALPSPQQDWHSPSFATIGKGLKQASEKLYG